MSKVNLTDRAVHAAKSKKGKRTYVWDAKVTGFGLRIEASERKTFVAKYRFKGQQRMVTLDRYPSSTLAEARAKAQAIIGRAQNGEDPNHTDLLPTKSGSFAFALETYFEKHCATALRQNTRHEVERALRREFLPPWKQRDIGDITKKDLVAILDGILGRGTPSAANHAFAYINHFFNWAVSRGVIVGSPCQGLSLPAAKVSRERVLSDHELSIIWHQAAKTAYPFGSIVQLLILTGQRRGEVTAMCWSQIDFENRIWTLPPELTKNSREHNLPLSDPALRILENVPRLSENFVFPARGSKTTSFSGFSKSKRKLSDACGIDNWTLHDLRRTVATGLARANTQPHVIEKILNHSSGTISGVAAVYNRFQYIDEIRDALNKWSEHVMALQSRK